MDAKGIRLSTAHSHASVRLQMGGPLCTAPMRPAHTASLYASVDHINSAAIHCHRPRDGHHRAWSVRWGACTNPPAAHFRLASAVVLRYWCKVEWDESKPLIRRANPLVRVAIGSSVPFDLAFHRLRAPSRCQVNKRLPCTSSMTLFCAGTETIGSFASLLSC